MTDDSDDITGSDEYGWLVRGNRQVHASDAGRSLDAQPSSIVLVDIPLYGGPLDGFVSRAHEPVRDLEMLRIVDANGNPSTGEVYLAREVDARWVGVHIDLLQDYVRSDEVHVHDPSRSISALMAANPDIKWHLAVPMCEPGQHRWSDWERTPKGNRTRICVVCKTSQGSLLS